MHILAKTLTCLWVSILFSSALFAQHTAIIVHDDKVFNNALELYNKSMYSAAKHQFDIVTEEKKASTINQQKAIYLAALCASELQHDDAETRLKSFIKDYPETIDARQAEFALSNWYYKKRKYRDALAYYENTDITFLTNTQINEYYFKKGYCHFKRKQFDEASLSFNQITKSDSKYSEPARYYYGHIAYVSDNYSTALETFKSLDDSPTFSALTPYYITQIYFEQGDYKGMIGYANQMGVRGNLKNKEKIDRLIAEAYFRTGDFENAAKHFNSYKNNTPRLSREDHYKLAYSNYRINDYEKAISSFEQVVSISDSLAQNTYFHLADCFLKTNDKKGARNSFQFASKMNFNKTIQEESSFNYAKLTYELAFQPVAIRAFKDFLDKYPSSFYYDEANQLLAQIYLTTKDYDEALIALENVKNKNPEVKEAYQKVAYYRGVQFYNDKNSSGAIRSFTKVINTPVDQNLVALAKYWKAESMYGVNKFSEAAKGFEEFIYSPASINLNEYATAHYNLGYCHLKQKNYASSIEWFRKYLKQSKKVKVNLKQDAQIRIADNYLMLKDYNKSKDYYQQAVKTSPKQNDYCTFQQGVIAGLQGDWKERERLMNNVIENYPSSSFADDALYEQGNALMAIGESKKAEKVFNKLINDFPQSNYNRKALVQVGLIYYNNANDKKALKTYKQVIETYPSTAEAHEALIGIKNIYVAQGNPDAYFEYVNTLSFASISSGAQDTITYEAAEQQFAVASFESASNAFSNYLSKFPNGYFKLNATFYKAESDYQLTRYNDALLNYEKIVAQPENLFTEKSLLKSASILLSNKDYSKSLKYYERLDNTTSYQPNQLASWEGQMKCNYHLENYDEAKTYSEKVLSEDNLSTLLKQDALLISSRSFYNLGARHLAKTRFQTLSNISSGEAGAIARHYLAQIAFDDGNYDEAENNVFKAIEQDPSYDYWVAKSFLLLSDVYVQKDNIFQAKHTLKSVIENYESSPNDPEDIQVIAMQKLDVLQQAENNRLINEEEPEEEIDEPEIEQVEGVNNDK
ncbi:MAG: tetratricopeptide repeat protein [Bacteroidia bacterium]|nr:tetratricopeptide repeat protein [Bacteroidia bacterium]NNM15423.1 tetratricopeptide repeat protein [Bacteroidia bacterium]